MQMTLPFLSPAVPGGRLFCYVLPVACVLWITLFYFQRPSRIPIIAATPYVPAAATATNRSSSNHNNSTSNGKDGIVTVSAATRPPPNIQPPPPNIQPPPDPCVGRYVYVHDLPSRFNTDLLRECRELSGLSDKTQFMSNGGIGPPLGESGGALSGSGGWYATDQFALDIIFYTRMKQYACLTNDSAGASAIYVPFFAGLEASLHLGGQNTSARDAAARDLARWLRSRPEWGVMGGRDHFLVAGRPAWDFRRFSNSSGEWGNKLLLLPEASNMSILVLESTTLLDNDISVPYPTYFHPSGDGQVVAWQDRIRGTARPWLFSFAGAPRPNQTAEYIRARTIEQCRGSRRCLFLDCAATDCNSPGTVIGAFQSSSFCLQPPGDSFTRRSAFDAMLAGCVPVFFHPASAQLQYRWHLPGNHSSYSVLIPEEEVMGGKVSIEERLAGIPAGEVKAMREEVIEMIPRLVYADPRSASRVTAKDAFELAVEGLIERADRLRKKMRG